METSGRKGLSPASVSGSGSGFGARVVQKEEPSTTTEPSFYGGGSTHRVDGPDPPPATDDVQVSIGFTYRPLCRRYTVPTIANVCVRCVWTLLNYIFHILMYKYPCEYIHVCWHINVNAALEWHCCRETPFSPRSICNWIS